MSAEAKKTPLTIDGDLFQLLTYVYVQGAWSGAASTMGHAARLATGKGPDDPFVDAQVKRAGHRMASIILSELRKDPLAREEQRAAFEHLAKHVADGDDPFASEPGEDCSCPR